MFECIDKDLGKSTTLNQWHHIFDSDYDLLSPYLRPTGDQSPVSFCPAYAQPTRQFDGSAGNEPECSSCCCRESCDFAQNTFGLWKFSPTRLASRLGSVFRLTPEPETLKDESVRIGTVRSKAEGYPAFLLKGGSGDYVKTAQNVLQNQQCPCFFITPMHCPETDQWSARYKMGYSSLEEQFEPHSFSLKRGCPDPLLKFKALNHSPADVAGAITHLVEDVRPGVFIEHSFKYIKFPDGYRVNLVRAPIRRAVVRFIHQQLAHTGCREFDVEVMRESYNDAHPKHEWRSVRIREDLFKRHPDDFDRLFDAVDKANGRYFMLV
ncbi:hypothetical protein [Pontiella sulfatireligans]|uniref:Uncharacterized protein n=1 Tax=Pontiella sulfatireligans TaxID=2750658 RepID=A0A6C2UGU6_9BACT|nr:hypothetical protein [Pontiella sulfatireligans]VGO19149.1 hypothetical protein SCARR_01206 [Pontiella sulfatireligans]